MLMTEEQQVKYLESNGTICPACGTEGKMMHFFPKVNISLQDGMLYLRKFCGTCSNEWVDMFTLVGVMDESELPK